MSRVRSAPATAWARWRPSTPYTVGLEEEVMLLDPETWELAPSADRLLATLDRDLAAHCWAETHAAAVELTTGAHATVGDAIAELGDLRTRLSASAAALGVSLASAGMHPGCAADTAPRSPGGRYQLIHESMRGIARREPTFALHVHVGVPGPDRAIDLFNRMRAHLPVLLALSASSPLWRGTSTDIASNRTILFQAFPRTGLPRFFDDYGDWVRMVDVLLRSGAIPEPTFLWWDVRPQPRLGTVEVRIMDAQPDLAATGALCALVQASARLELEEGHASSVMTHSQEILEENRFLAARDGPAAELIDPSRAVAVPLTDVLRDLLLAAAPHAEALGCATELAHVPDVARATEAQRQQDLAATAGVRGLVADLAGRFAAR
jgi:carboxylate-amine ligase